MTKKDILLILGFVVVPGGIVLATLHYGPKVKKWYQDKKINKEKENDNTTTK